ncbi:MAG: DUF3108 domain-containing protein [Candidatus Eisenbacteria bacterium]|nr:DUF3108 domain-containing protein [Candidatus Eisenbacteria bacterium]
MTTPLGTRLPAAEGGLQPMRRFAAHLFVRALLSATLLFGAVPLPAMADETDLPDTNDLSLGNREVLPASEHPFQPGESLRFSVQYGFIKAGSAWLEVPEVTEWNGRPVYRLVARAESNGFFDKMYKVRNRIESMWDRDSLFSWRYFEDRREGHFRANDTLVFEPSKREVHYNNGLSYPVPAQVQDALSAFYFTRFKPLPLGGSVVFDYHASRKSAPMEVRVLGRQTVKTPAGKFKCVVIEPLLKAGGIFKNKGRLVIWLTDDERRMPVLMKSKVLIGSISVVLQEAKPGA